MKHAASTRSTEAVNARRWVPGQGLHLPDDIPLSVNVTVKIPGEAGDAFIPPAVDAVGLTVSNPEAEPHEEILRIFNIDTVTEAEGLLIYVPGPPPGHRSCRSTGGLSAMAGLLGTVRGGGAALPDSEQMAPTLPAATEDKLSPTQSGTLLLISSAEDVGFRRG